ncbi:hypothetical protein ACFORL_01695 [Legionella dresdenensis]|uniref:Uncharacterized protein n=1 Tax=Legionella dresdenensis TaxID=450200 RepID=A0ABV8CCW7_9GAMM
MTKKIESTVVVAFKIAVSQGDLTRCQEILSDYANDEEELATALESADINSLKELTCGELQYAGMTTVPFPFDAPPGFINADEYCYFVGEKYAECFKKIPPDPAYLECFKLINKLLTKYNPPSIARKDEVRRCPDLSPPSLIDFDMPPETFGNITSENSPGHFSGFRTHWPVKSAEKIRLDTLIGANAFSLLSQYQYAAFFKGIPKEKRPVCRLTDNAEDKDCGMPSNGIG